MIFIFQTTNQLCLVSSDLPQFWYLSDLKHTMNSQRRFRVTGDVARRYAANQLMEVSWNRLYPIYHSFIPHLSIIYHSLITHFHHLSLILIISFWDVPGNHPRIFQGQPHGTCTEPREVVDEKQAAWRVSSTVSGRKKKHRGSPTVRRCVWRREALQMCFSWWVIWGCHWLHWPKSVRISPSWIWKILRVSPDPDIQDDRNAVIFPCPFWRVSPKLGEKGQPWRVLW